MYAASVLKDMQDVSYAAGDIPEELRTTDRILQRWAVSIGMGLPSDEWDENPKSRPPPLDDGTAIVVDQIVVRSPPITNSLIREWYKKPTPCPTMAKNRRMTLKSLYKSHRIALGFFRFKFETSGHADLVRLVASQHVR
jgi:hypothetical protein